MIPRATYRLQFHRDFTFEHAARLAPYLAKLGISHVYASPILEARRGSVHGYDVVDHSKISEERGGLEGFTKMAAALKSHGLGIILDIVPNHMAVGGSDNRWWLDVLEHGPSSVYATYFDIDWESEGSLHGKVLAPFLGRPFEEAIASGAVQLVYDEKLGKLAFAYFEHRFPLRPVDYGEVLGSVPRPTPERLAQLNQPDHLRALLGRQHFMLAWWRTARDQINWRRFFDITELAALRIENEPVFEAVHAVAFSLYEHGQIDGLRIDHIDGLTDPPAYCRRLNDRLAAIGQRRPQAGVQNRAYVVVEKILARNEVLSNNWAVDGTTGYDFLGQVSAVQHDESGATALDRIWEIVAKSDRPYEHYESEARAELLQETFARQLRSCAGAFHAAAVGYSNDLPHGLLARALIALIVELRVYRTYGSDGTSRSSNDALEEAAARASKHAAQDVALAVAFIRRVLLGGAELKGTAAPRAAAQFNQLATSVAAKAVEDTAFYRYSRLISRNDVGCNPGALSLSVPEFHRKMEIRAESFPLSLLATATHDHKRGEDARARLAVLSEVPGLWQAAVEEWLRLISPYRTADVDEPTIYLLFQALVGHLPLDAPLTDAALASFGKRIEIWLEKALREAKLRTSWTDPNRPYEEACRRLLHSVLGSAPFVASLTHLVESILSAGTANSVVQCVLRNTVPGVPDLYQGAEFWDFSFVDPDNRREVDFLKRETGIGARDLASDAKHEGWRSGLFKQEVLRRLLALRKGCPALFSAGHYCALAATGARKDNILAFARYDDDSWMVVITALRCAKELVGTPFLSPSASWWDDTAVSLEAPAGIQLRPTLAADHSIAATRSLRIAPYLETFPAEVFFGRVIGR